MRITYELGHKGSKQYDTDNRNDMPVNNIYKAINKLGQLEDIEEELGIDLITLYKAFRYGIYAKTRKHNGYVAPQDLRGKLGWAYILDFSKDNVEDHSHPDEVKLIFGKTGICLSSMEYGRTRALDKNELEELEND